MAFAIPWQLFDRPSGEDKRQAKTERREETAATGSRLLCRRCRNPVTEAGMGIVFDGNHVHSRINPAGIVYDFACYRHAPGCNVVGPPVREHSWFAGYTWQIALCSRCGEHMGWRFRGEDGFFGLILDRLIEEDY